MSAITKAIQKTKAKGNAALIGYVTAGDPMPELTPQIADALIRGGVDVLELGLPFSDPIADGPTIQAASVRALTAGTTPTKVLQMAKEIRKTHETPIVIMTYYNPVFRMGIEKFCRLAKQNMVDGVIVPDLPVEESGDFRKAAADFGLDTIFLAAPSTSMERLKAIVECFFRLSLPCFSLRRNGNENGSGRLNNRAHQTGFASHFGKDFFGGRLRSLKTTACETNRSRGSRRRNRRERLCQPNSEKQRQPRSHAQRVGSCCF